MRLGHIDFGCRSREKSGNAEEQSAQWARSGCRQGPCRLLRCELACWRSRRRCGDARSAIYSLWRPILGRRRFAAKLRRLPADCMSCRGISRGKTAHRTSGRQLHDTQAAPPTATILSVWHRTDHINRRQHYLTVASRLGIPFGCIVSERSRRHHDPFTTGPCSSIQRDRR